MLASRLKGIPFPFRKIGKVQCADCGFLALRNTRTDGLAEARFRYRETGEVPLSETPIEIRTPTPDGDDEEDAYTSPYQIPPVCFVGAHNLSGTRRSTANVSKSPMTRDEALAIVQEGRACTKFIRWVQGYSPREHLEMERMKDQKRGQRIWNFTLIIVAIMSPAATLLAALLKD